MPGMILFFFKLDLAFWLAAYNVRPWAVCRYYKEIGMRIKSLDDEEAAIDRIWSD